MSEFPPTSGTLPVAVDPIEAPVSRGTLVVVLLTFNSAAVVRRTVEAAARTAGRIVAVDSFSTDATVDILRELGVELVQRPFLHYADQRNWAITQLETRFAWQLHLDADEVLDERAAGAVRRVVDAGSTDRVYLLYRRQHFMGRRLRFGGANSWHLRLFRSGDARCEDRLYDQHFVSELPTRRLAGGMDDLNVGTLTEWTARHNRWSSLEAEELTRRVVPSSGNQIAARLAGDTRERRRFYKGAYYRAPPLWRAIGYFLVRYVVQLGFMDGRTGFLYAALQAFWFRVLVDAKLDELERGSIPRQ